MASLMLVNPRKRRKTSVTRRRRKNPVAANPRRRRSVRRVSTRPVRHHRRRRNPISTRGIMGQIMPAATAAFGALGLDMLWGYAPIPEALKTGPMRYLAKAAGAVGLGMLAGMVVKKSTADQMSMGALTVVLHSAMRDGMSSYMPNIALGEYMSPQESLGYWGSAYNPAYTGNGVGEYLPSPGGDYGMQGMEAYSTMTL